LSVYFEKDQQSEMIEQVVFLINENSKKVLNRW